MEHRDESRDGRVDDRGGGVEDSPLGIESTLGPAEIASVARPTPNGGVAPDGPIPGGRELRPGDRLGRFEVLGQLGQGGFGTVYEARDTELGRRVAIKILRLREDTAERWRPRFADLLQREAEAAARLNHPNIVTLYDVGSWQGLPYLILELMEGETLAQRLGRGPLLVDEALGILVAVARGLAHAHHAGIVHRDLKPSNVIVGPRGDVKLLDLGLARVVGAIEEMSARDEITPFRSRVSTLLGGAGTPAYMSPEQWRGEPQDERVDVFAAGVILFELLTGRLPFELGKHGGRDLDFGAPTVPLETLAPDVPAGLAALVKRALAPRPADRFKDGEELLEALLAQESERERERSVPAQAPRTRRAMLPGLLVAGAVTAAVLVWALVLRQAPPAPAGAAPEHRQVTFVGDAGHPALSPDGRRIAYVSRGSLFIQPLGEGRARRVYRRKFIGGLRWSPDGSELLFCAWDDAGSQNLVVSHSGGEPTPVPTRSTSQAWSPDGKRLAFAPMARREIIIVERGAKEERSLKLQGRFIWVLDLDWSPRGDGFVVLTKGRDGYSLRVVSEDGRQQRRLLRERLEISSPRWSGSEAALYYLQEKSGTWDLRKVALDGRPQAILTGLQAGRIISISRDGRRILYTREPQLSNVAVLTIPAGATDRPARARRITRGTSFSHSPALSPDGKRIAFSVGRRPKANLFVVSVAGGRPRQVTFLDAWSAGAAWSPDGSTLAFGSTAGGSARVWTVPAGGGEPRVFAGTALHDGPTYWIGWTPKGRIVFQRPGSRRFEVLEPRTRVLQPLMPLREPRGWVFSPRVSPDGDKVAVLWNRREAQGMWVVSRKTGKSHLLRLGYVFPIGWSADGRSVYAGRLTDFDLMRVERIERIEAQSGRLLATIPLPRGQNFTQPAITGDGRIVVATTVESRSDLWLAESPPARPQ